MGMRSAVNKAIYYRQAQTKLCFCRCLCSEFQADRPQGAGFVIHPRCATGDLIAFNSIYLGKIIC